MSSVDRETASLTLTNVIETVLPLAGEHTSPASSFHAFVGASVFATWAKTSDEDSDQKFECRVSGTKPDGKTLFESPWLPVSFPKNIYFHRVHIGLPNFGAFDQIGLYLLRAELRRAGAEQSECWQEVPFRVLGAPTDA
jgi:hypothetical protein